MAIFIPMRWIAAVTQVHPTALVDPDVRLGSDVTVGPFAIIEGDVEIGDRCHIAARTFIKHGVRIGHDCKVGEGSVFGGEPQHLSESGGGGVIIGPHNVFRENCTVHRAISDDTVIGDRNYFMVNAHVAHDVVLGDDCIIANNVMLGGHVLVQDFAYVSGGVAVHQFCRIGREVMIGGQARITRDVPPYVMICGDTSRVVGLNLVGLRRRGYKSPDIKQLKAAYRQIYRSQLPWKEIVATMQSEYIDGPAACYGEFFKHGERGYVPERRVSRPATLKVFSDDSSKTAASNGDEPKSDGDQTRRAG